MNDKMVWPRVAFALAAMAYLVISVDRLSTFPLVGEDEPWIAAAPVKLAAQGTLGNDLFTGYYGMEQHHLQHMPVYPILEAGVFKLFGVGVWQMRALSVAFGLVLLVAVFLVGAQMGDEWLGVLGVVLLMTLRVTLGDDGTGIMLLDRARINRYDIAVPVFGLFALLTFNRARGPFAFACAGLLAGLASLSHLYGIFWLPILLLLAAQRFARGACLGVVAWLVGGFLVPWVPWATYIAPRWSDYIGQLKPTGARFDVLNPNFYAQNFLYANGPLSVSWVVGTLRDLPADRVGTWVMLLGLVLSILTVICAIRRGEMSVVAISVVIAAVLQLLLFSSLLAVKTMSYMIAIWPLAALVIAWSAVWLWRHSGRVVRVGLVIIIAIAIGEGSGRIARARQIAEQVSPYDFYTGEIAACIPPGSRVLGLQHYWLGLRQFEFRSWLLPINMSRTGWYQESLTLEQALRRVDPTIVLVDRYMSAFLEENNTPDRAYYSDVLDVKRFMTDRRAELVCVIKDRSYGTMLVYRLVAGAPRSEFSGPNTP